MTALTDLVYAEFDSTNQTLLADLITHITASASWSKISSTASLGTLSAASSSNVLTFAAGSVPAVTVGQVIRIGEAGASDTEYRNVQTVTSTTVTCTFAFSNAHAVGTKVYQGGEVLKATTSTGIDMVLDLMDSYVTLATTSHLNMAVYRAHDGTPTGGTDRSPRWLYWRGISAAASGSSLVHCIVSASKDHLYVSVEGPRFSETDPDGASYGSIRSYFFMDTLVPYFTNDVPTIFVGGNTTIGYLASTGSSALGFISRSFNGATAWDQARLGTVTFPTNGISASMNYERQSIGDGQYYLFPYVALSDAAGIRGRLGHFFFAGHTNPDYISDLTVSPPSLGSKVTFEGNTYKLLSVNRGAGSSVWGQFGAATNTSGGPNGIVVAVPCLSTS